MPAKKKKTDDALVTKAVDPETGEALKVPRKRRKPLTRPMRIRLTNPLDDFEPPGGWRGPTPAELGAKQGEIVTLEKVDALALVESGRAGRVHKGEGVPRQTIKEHLAELGLEVKQ